MALTSVAALVAARWRSLLNRMRRESGPAGEWIGLILAAVVALVVALPALTLLRLGSELGASWSTAEHETLAPRWMAIQAVFTLLFPVLAVPRYRPAFEPGQIGALPVDSGELLLAELPSAMLEVFPLLGVAGVLASNLGLALGSSALAPLALLLAVQGVAWLLALSIALGGVWLRIDRRALRVAAVVLGAGALVGWLSGVDRVQLKAMAIGAVRLLPGSWLPDSHASFAAGDLAGAAMICAAALVATGLLVALAARVRMGLLDAPPLRRGERWRGLLLGRRSGAEGAISGLFLVQLFDARAGRTLFWLPALLTVPGAIAAGAIRLDRAELRALPESLEPLLREAAAAPWYALVAVAVVLVDSPIWLNPFGWFRGGLRSLLALPAGAGEILRGTLRGLTLFVGGQTALALLPLLLLRWPRPDELLAGAGAAAFALVVVGGVGQAVGLQFPRRVEREGSAEIPFHRSWIPTLVAAVVALLVALAGRIAALVDGRAPAVVFPVLALLAAAGYSKLQPLLEAELRSAEDRLVSL